MNINKCLFGHNIKSIKPFNVTIDRKNMKIVLEYIHNWSGLTSSSKIPNTFKQYQDKSRNWLNGRRTKKYGNTLFPMMINECVKYSKNISDILYPNNNDKNKQYHKLYQLILRNSFLLNILQLTITLNKSVKTTHLIPEHPLKTKTKVRALIQKYCIEQHQSQSSFPCHRTQAIDYFKNQYIKYLNTLKIKRKNEKKIKIKLENTESIKNINNIKNIEKLHTGNDVEIEKIVKHIINKTIATKDNNDNIYIQRKDFRDLINIIIKLKNNSENDKQKINVLKNKIKSLEHEMCSYLIQNIFNQLM